MPSNMYPLSRSTAENAAHAAEMILRSEGVRGAQRFREFRAGADQDYVDRLSELWGAVYRLPQIDSTKYPSAGVVAWKAKVPRNRARRITERRVPKPPMMLHRHIDSSSDRVAQGVQRGEQMIEDVVERGDDPIAAVSDINDAVEEATRNRALATVQYRVAAQFRHHLGISKLAEALGVSEKSVHRLGATPVLKGFDG